MKNWRSSYSSFVVAVSYWITCTVPFVKNGCDVNVLQKLHRSKTAQVRNIPATGNRLANQNSFQSKFVSRAKESGTSSLGKNAPSISQLEILNIPQTKTHSIAIANTIMSNKQRIIFTLFSCILQLHASCAFSVVPHSKPLVSTTETSSALNVGTVWFDDDESNLNWIPRANDCLNSESCELEEAQTCLNNLAEVTLSDLPSKDASAVSKAIANLRQKIKTTQRLEQQQSATSYHGISNAMNVIAVAYVVWAILHDMGSSELLVDNSAMSCFDAYSTSLYF